MSETPALAGITVLDFSTVGPASRCSRILADYGATVVKVGAPPKKSGVQIQPVFHAYSAGRGMKQVRLDLKAAEEALTKKALPYDKDGEEHYNLISAFHKSLRGSDVHASIYWLYRMLVAGEDPLFIARRMIRFSSEDIGLADPDALQIALAAFDIYTRCREQVCQLRVNEVKRRVSWAMERQSR